MDNLYFQTRFQKLAFSDTQNDLGCVNERAKLIKCCTF